MAAGAFYKMRTQGFWSKLKNFGSKVWNGIKKGAATVLDGIAAFGAGAANAV